MSVLREREMYISPLNANELGAICVVHDRSCLESVTALSLICNYNRASCLKG
jgi:hypothetical protein